MGKFRIMWDNKLDAATLLASSEAAGLPVANLQHDWFLTHWRSTGVASEWVDADLGSALAIRAFFIYSHNLRQGADLTIQADDDPVYGSPGINDVIAITADMVAQNLVGKFWLSAQTFRYWLQILADAASGHPDGYIREGRVFLGDYFEFADRPEEYPDWSPVDPSEVLESLGGQRNINVRPQYQRLKWRWPAVSAAEFETLRTIFATIGHRPFFVCWDSDDPINSTLYVHTAPEWNFPPFAGTYRSFDLVVETER